MEQRKLIEFEPSQSQSNFRCGNSMFLDNTWDFNGLVDTNYLSGKRLMIIFDDFAHKTHILETIKKYIVYELLKNKFTTVKRNFDGLKRFIKYIDEKAPYLESFSEINSSILTDYFNYLLSSKSETTSKPLSATAIKKAALPIKEILISGAIRGWDVPEYVGFVQRIYDEQIINNTKLRKMVKKSEKKTKDKVIDSSVIDQVLKFAMEDLDKNEDIIAAAAVIIGSQTGVRVSELLSIKENCIQVIGGDRMITYTTSKLHSEKTLVHKPINTMVEYAISKVIEYTKKLREEARTNLIFLGRNRNIVGYPIGVISQSNFNKNYIRPWIIKHNITNKDGTLIEFTSHTFRHIFATYSLKNGASIETISKLMNHKSIRGTQHYTHLIEEDVKSRFKQILNEGAVISGKKALTIKNKLKEHNPFRGKTTDQVDKLRRAMKIQVLSHGLCLHHPMRNEPCAGDGVCLGCNNFITTPEYLDVHKGRLDRVRAELDKVSDSDTQGPFESKLRHIEKYLVEIITDLENQLEYRGKKDNSNYTS